MKRLIFVGGITLLFALVLIANGTSDQGQPNTVTGQRGAIVFDFGDPYLSSRLLPVAALCIIMLVGIWGAKPPKGHENWAGASVGSAMVAVIVFCVCGLALAYAFHSQQADIFTAILGGPR